MSTDAAATRPPRRLRHAGAALLVGCVSVLGATALAAVPVGAQPGATTTTLPVANDNQFNEIIPAPNSGRAPEEAGDPGGWLQVSLFFLLCAVILGIVVAVWWRSRVLRRRREAAGLDPITLARARGEGVRRPR